MYFSIFNGFALELKAVYLKLFPLVWFPFQSGWNLINLIIVWSKYAKIRLHTCAIKPKDHIPPWSPLKTSKHHFLISVKISVPVCFRTQHWAKYSSLQLMANCIKAIRCLWSVMSNWIENHPPQGTQIPTVTNTPFIQNSNQMAFSVTCNSMFSECVLSTPAIFTATSKFVGSQGFSDDKNCLIFQHFLQDLWILQFNSAFAVSFHSTRSHLSQGWQWDDFLGPITILFYA